MKNTKTDDLFCGELFAEFDALQKPVKKIKSKKKTFTSFLLKEVGQDKNERQIYQVSEINLLVKVIVEQNFSEIWIEGEISNGKLHSSGHFYFSLKDEDAQIKAVMFNHIYGYLKFQPKDGMKVLVKGTVSCFVKAGSYQINAVYMEPQGVGALQLAFEQLKEKLLKEGLFDREHKKPIPILPQKIGIITSPTGAAIRDILSVLDRRYSNLNVIIYPVRVQGDEAKFEIVEAIRYFNNDENLMDIDVILLGRGGGSIEDLWAFNEEIVARAIFGSKIPIISCVGHEVDFVIADFVSDLRAPTPSAAAELVVRDKEELRARIDFFRQKLVNKIKNIYDTSKTRFEFLKNEKILKNPNEFFDDKLQILDYIFDKILANISKILDRNAYKLGILKSKVEAINPDKIIAKGYAIIKAETGAFLRADEIKVDDRIKIFVKNFEILCKVLTKQK